MAVSAFRRSPRLADQLTTRRLYEQATGVDRDRVNADLALVADRLAPLVSAADGPQGDALVLGASRCRVAWVAAGRTGDRQMSVVGGRVRRLGTAGRRPRRRFRQIRGQPGVLYRCLGRGTTADQMRPQGQPAGTGQTCPMVRSRLGVERVLVASSGLGRLAFSNCLLLVCRVGFRTKRQPARVRSRRCLERGEQHLHQECPS